MIFRRVKGHFRVGVFSLRNIFSNEELTIDYKSAKHLTLNFEQKKCFCGSKDCLTFIPAIFTLNNLEILKTNKIFVNEMNSKFKKQKFKNLITEFPTTSEYKKIYNNFQINAYNGLFLRRNIKHSLNAIQKRTISSNYSNFLKHLTFGKHFFVLLLFFCLFVKLKIFFSFVKLKIFFRFKFDSGMC